MERELLHQLPGRNPELVADAFLPAEEIAELTDEIVPLLVERHRVDDVLHERVGHGAAEGPACVLRLDSLSDLHLFTPCEAPSRRRADAIRALRVRKPLIVSG